MARRALRRIAPDLDYSPWYHEAATLPAPFDAATLFRRHAPLEVEVGSGKGLFLAAAAAANPETDFLGIEISEKYARYSAARAARRNLNNALVVHGDARRIFADLLPNNVLRAVHIYFPDPWWKARHKKRRIVSDDFLPLVERALAPGGKLHFWTDVEEYFRAGVESARESTRLVGPIPVEETPAAHDLDYRTHFERRTRRHGLPVFRAEFHKRADD